MAHPTPAEVLGPMYPGIAADVDAALRLLALSPDAAILDVGTGKGNFAIALALRGFRVLTGEPAADETRYARQAWAANAERLGVLDRIRFQPFAAEQLPFADGSFDAVFFFGVLHHIPEELRERVLGEALRVVKRHGAVVFFEPRQATLEKLWVEDPGHPLAADPTESLGGLRVREQRHTGALMEIFILRPE